MECCSTGGCGECCSSHSSMWILPVLALVLAFVGSFLGSFAYLSMKAQPAQIAAVQDVKPTPTNNAQPTQPTAPAAGEKVNIDTSKLSFIGGPDAKVTVVEFSDFQCPFCSRFHQQTYGQIFDKYIKTNKIKYSFVHLPLSFHQNALPAAIASECVATQSKDAFWKMHDVLFEKQSEWSTLADTKTKFLEYAKGLEGVDAKKLETCIDAKEPQSKISADMALAASAGATGTPTFLINGERLVGAQPYQTFEQKIDALLK